MSVFGNTGRLARIKECWKGRTVPLTASMGYVQDVKWLIGQAQLVEDLTKKRKSDAVRNASIEEENARLREALEFYANESTWQNGTYYTVEGGTQEDAPPFIYDMGDKARITLLEMGSRA